MAAPIVVTVPTDQVPRIVRDVTRDHGTIVSQRDNGNGTTTLTISYPSAAVKTSDSAKLLTTMVKAGFATRGGA